MDSENAKLLDRPLVFISPFIMTTAGHKNIYDLIARAAKDAGFDILPIYSLNLTTYERLVKCKPRIVLMDFPDHNEREHLRTLKQKLRDAGTGTEFVYLLMHTNAELPVPVLEHGLYDTVLAIEPDIHHEDGNNIVQFSPITNPDHVVIAEERWAEIADYNREKGEKYLLVMQSGNEEERTFLAQWAATFQRKYGLLDHHLRLSKQLPQPAVHFAPLAAHIIAAPGYSTFWELNLLGCAHKTTWVQLQRPLENCHARVTYGNTPYPRGGLHSLTLWLKEKRDGRNP
jgi:hypothetical protein